MGCIICILSKCDKMIDVKNLILSVFVIIMVISFSVKYSISQNKLSEEVIKHIIIDIDCFLIKC